MKKTVPILGTLGLLLGILTLLPSAAAQTELSPETVQVTATDGLTLVGDYYMANGEGETGPAVLLMHMLGSDRSAWSPLIPALVEAGYHVLAVDMRGHGDTGGRADWSAAEGDVQTWLDWLRARPEVDSAGVSIVGASIGSNLALIGCANDVDCVTAIALSPGLDYRGVQPLSALIDGLSNRSALVIASHGDSYSADSVKELAAGAAGEVGMRLYAGRAHGTQLFSDDGERLTRTIIAWLDEYTPQGN
ncbi:MAG: alpha/beta fold hydrolase [Anaerolineaceae bacterium]|nr:alpha/beta fold hydrolase [Anaerolineaceae bacterium]